MQNFKIEKLLSLPKKIVLLALTITLLSCGVNKEQRDFEQAALSPPENITEMTNGGVPVENEEADSNDWRIAPEFKGLIEVTPAYPNPVHFNGTLKIDLYVTGVGAVGGLYVYIFQFRKNSLEGPFYIETQMLNPGLISIRLSPRQFAQQGTGAPNLYRIVIYDGSQNIITYGDVKVI